jgi:hypothetical protein
MISYYRPLLLYKLIKLYDSIYLLHNDLISKLAAVIIAEFLQHEVEEDSIEPWILFAVRS